MYIIVLSDRFEKKLKKLVKSNRPLKSQVNKTIKELSCDIEHPSLRLHKLVGRNYWSVSVNKSVRIVLRWNEDKLYLLDIGKHEEVY